MRAIEDRSEEAGVSTDTLMENAGLAVARTARRMLGPLTGVPVVVLVGSGNNGADGLVAARHIQRWGARVTAYICRERGAPDPKMEDALRDDVDIVSVSDDPDLARLKCMLNSAHLVIDAMLGTGRARPIEGVFEEILSVLAVARRGGSRTAQLLALDLPTGLNCDTAEVDPACVPADVTVALGYPKRGHLTFPGADSVGDLEVADIGVPPGLDDDVQVSLLASEWARAALPERPGDSHKGTFGRTMIVAGSRQFLGAAYLAAASAARVGAGLVTIAIPASLVSSVAPAAIEPTFLPLPENREGVVSPDAADDILEAVSGYSSLLVGCGLGQADETRTMVERLLLSGAALPPTVVDADGLNTLARIPDWHRRWPSNAVLTPHPGEMARLVNSPKSSLSITQQIPSPLMERARACPVLDTGVRVLPRLDLAQVEAREWNKTVVLKGAYTVVAHADGASEIAPFSNPGLATAGTGDVLAGTIAGLLSQGLSPETAASLGVYLHGLAGEVVRERLGDTGMVASDLLPELPVTIKSLR